MRSPSVPLAGMAAAGALVVLAACTDGTTPDCSEAGVCGYILPEAGEGGEAGNPEAATAPDGAAEGSVDGSVDAAIDAPAEGDPGSDAGPESSAPDASAG